MKYDAEGCLKIFDFGMARNASVNASTLGLVGTRGYMAPELFDRGSDGRVSFTPAVDVFAFGATALALVLRRLPADLLHVPPLLPSADVDFAALPLEIPVEISTLLNRCLDPNPENRPKMIDIAQVIGRHLLRDQHRALLVSGGKTYALDKDSRVVNLSVKNQGDLTVTYDGLRFVVSDINGDVAINNMTASDGDILPGSCVIVLGNQSLGTRRTMITIDVSHPEVAL
jgi:eukaryotic-like serine/threonine-protein kinase